MATLWKIVGGSATGGLLVRNGESTDSAEVGRLSSGAQVQEVELVGCRLRYKLIDGQGPVEGWVTTSLRGRPLAEPLNPDGSVKEAIEKAADGSVAKKRKVHSPEDAAEGSDDEPEDIDVLKNFVLQQHAEELKKDPSRMLTVEQIRADGLDEFAGYRFSGSLRPAHRTSRMPAPENCHLPDYATHKNGTPRSELVARRKRDPPPIVQGEDLLIMREACRLGREVLDIAGKAVRVGATGDEIDRLVWQSCAERNVYPSPLGYSGFLKSVCISPNEVICHGIPDCRPLQEGDIVNLDVSVFHNGFHADLNEMFFVGNCDEASHNLVRASYEALQAASKWIKPGTMYRELGNVIHDVAEKHGCTSVPQFVGHGVGRLFHGAPDVPHYRKNKAIGTMKPGHIFTVEPMLNIGKNGRSKCWPDGWTQVTTSGNRSAQFEHTFLVTETGVELLTARTGTDSTCMPDYDPMVYQR